MIYVRLMICMLMVSAAALPGAVYYCDPDAGDTGTGDGSSASPWGTLQSVQEAGYFNGVKITGGDTVKLRTGFHGALEITKYAVNTEYLTIMADEGATADLSKIIIKNCTRWRFQGLRISPSLASPSLVVAHAPGGTATPKIVYGYNNSYIWIEDCLIYTVEDASVWAGAEDWVSYTWKSVDIRASYCTFRNNTIRNVMAGPYVGGYSLVEGNTIDGFCDDGMRISGGNCIIQDNNIINAYEDNDSVYTNPSDYHQDGIQMTEGTQAVNTVIRRNYINARTDTSRLVATVPSLQGIFLEPLYFNGIIENNVVLACSEAHGISLDVTDPDTTGLITDTRIVNNTILRSYGCGNWPNINLKGNYWNLVVRNNIADNAPSNASDSLTADHNVAESEFNPLEEFVDYPNGDLRLVEGSRFINAGSSLLASTEDKDGYTRSDGTPDIGAYEYQATGVEPSMPAAEGSGIRLLSQPAGAYAIFGIPVRMAAMSGSILIHDTGGVMVAILRCGSGTCTVRWDGTDLHGVPAAPGTYLYTVSVDGITEHGRFVKVR